MKELINFILAIIGMLVLGGIFWASVTEGIQCIGTVICL